MPDQNDLYTLPAGEELKRLRARVKQLEQDLRYQRQAADAATRAAARATESRADGFRVAAWTRRTSKE
jgi:outer membrane murein-binding lipoprotein Lpp